MNIASYLKFIEPIQDQLSGVYSTATLLISIFLILWFLNFVITLISRIFIIGKTVGGFYRSYVHKYIRSIIFNITNLISLRRSVQ